MRHCRCEAHGSLRGVARWGRPRHLAAVAAPRALLPLALAALLAPAAARPFAFVAEGERVPDDEMPTLDGGRAHVLGAARANVFVFFRPSEHSADLLERLARCEREFQGRSVRWVGIVSDDYPADEVRAMVKAAGVRMPVLVDRANAYYGRLGVRLHPVVGIADAEQRLVAYEHFRKINMEERIRARVERLLGLIDDAAVARVLDPPSAADDDDPTVAARRWVGLARMLLERRNYGAARDMAARALEIDPKLASAHAMLAQALAGLGACAEAREQARMALRLDPREARVEAAEAACGGR